MPHPLISESDLAVDWPPSATCALDHLAQSPHGPGLAVPMADLDLHLQHQHHHQHEQHLHGVYSWPGLWIDTNIDHDFRNMDSHARQLSYSDPVFSSHSEYQAPSYFEHPMDHGMHYAMVQSPAMELDYTQGTINPSSTSTVSSSSTEASVASPIEKKPRTQRERNRLAAHKCRQKSKVNAEELQRQERELAEQHRFLTQHVQFLRNEVLDLKNEILRHGTCDCELIGEYIARAAQSLP